VLRDVEIPHFIDSRVTDGGDVVNLTRRQPFTPRKIPGTNLCQRPNTPKGHNAAGRIRSIEKSSDLIGYQTRYLPTCSIVPQPTTLPRASNLYGDVLLLLVNK
jgi:hypothetical protein